MSLPWQSCNIALTTALAFVVHNYTDIFIGFPKEKTLKNVAFNIVMSKKAEKRLTYSHKIASS